MKVLAIVLGALMILGGIYCVCSPGAMFLSLAWVIGILVLVEAVGSICTYSRRRAMGLADGWSLAEAIISLLLALFLIFSDVFKFYTDIIIAYTAGIWVISIGVIQLVRAFRIKKIRDALPPEARHGVWAWILVLGILTVLLGIYAFLNPFITALAIGTLMGIFVICGGLNLIISACDL